MLEAPAPSRTEADLPRVSVVIPARNAINTIKQQIDAILTQEYAGSVEIIVADNGSTDGTYEVVRHLGKEVSGLRPIDASEVSGSSFARNKGAAVATGDVLAFCDADDVVMHGWLEALATAVARGVIATGTQCSCWFIESPADESAFDFVAPRFDGRMPIVPSGNFAITQVDFIKLGGFDESKRYMVDVDLTCRAMLGGMRIAQVPNARLLYRTRERSRDEFRRYYRWGVATVDIYRTYGPALGIQPDRARLLWRWYYVLTRLPLLLFRSRSADIAGRLGLRLGRLRGSLQFRTFAP